MHGDDEMAHLKSTPSVSLTGFQIKGFDNGVCMPARRKVNAAFANRDAMVTGDRTNSLLPSAEERTPATWTAPLSGAVSMRLGTLSPTIPLPNQSPHPCRQLRTSVAPPSAACRSSDRGEARHVMLGWPSSVSLAHLRQPRPPQLVCRSRPTAAGASGTLGWNSHSDHASPVPALPVRGFIYTPLSPSLALFICMAGICWRM